MFKKLIGTVLVLLLCAPLAYGYRTAVKDTVVYPDSLDCWPCAGDSNLSDQTHTWYADDINTLRWAAESLMVYIGIRGDTDQTTISGRVGVLESALPAIDTVTYADSAGTANDADSADQADVSDSALVAAWAHIASSCTTWVGSTAVYDSLTAHRTQIDKNVDSLTAHRTQIDENIDSLTAHTADVVALWDSVNSVGGKADTARYGDDPVFDVVDSLAVAGGVLFNDVIWGGYDNSAQSYHCFPWEGCAGDTAFMGEDVIYVKSPVYFDSIVVFNGLNGYRLTGPSAIGMDQDGIGVNSEAYWDTAGILHLGADDSLKFGDGVAFTRDGSQIVSSHRMKFPGGYLGDGDSTLNIHLVPDTSSIGLFLTYDFSNITNESGSYFGWNMQLPSAGLDHTPNVAKGGRVDIGNALIAVGLEVDVVGQDSTVGLLVNTDDALSGIHSWAAILSGARTWITEDLIADKDIYCDSLHGVADSAVYAKNWAGKGDSAAVADTALALKGITRIDTSTVSDTTLALKGITRIDSCANADTSAWCTAKIDSAVYAESTAYVDTSDYASYAGWSYDGAACDTADYAHAGDSVNHAINADSSTVADSALTALDDDWVVSDSITATDGNFTGDLYVGDDAAITAELTAADIDISDSLLAASVTASGVIQAEQLTSTDDATITAELTAADIDISDSLLAASVTASGVIYGEQLTSSDDATITDDLSAADAYITDTLTATTVVADLTGDVTGDVTGTADSALACVNADSSTIADTALVGKSMVFEDTVTFRATSYVMGDSVDASFDSVFCNAINVSITADTVAHSDTSDYAKDFDKTAITWGDAIDLTGDEVDVVLAPLQPGLEFSSGYLRVDVDGSTINRGGSGIYVMQDIYESIGDNNTTFDETNANPDCGAALIGVDNTEFDLSSGTDVQDVLDDHDSWIVAYSDSAADFEVSGVLTADSMAGDITTTGDLAVEGTVTVDSLVGDVTVTGELTADSLMGSVNIETDLTVNGELTVDTLASDVVVSGDVTADTLKGELKPASGNERLYGWGPLTLVNDPSIRGGTQSYGASDHHWFDWEDTVVVTRIRAAFTTTGTDPWSLFWYDGDDNVIACDTFATTGDTTWVEESLANTTIYPAEGIYGTFTEISGTTSLTNIFITIEGYYPNP